MVKNFRIEENCEEPRIDSTPDGNEILVLPSHLSEIAQAFFKEKEEIMWWDVWERFRFYGLRHPKHGRWIQQKTAGQCNQYYVDHRRPVSGPFLLRICKLEKAHLGTHTDGIMIWNDYEADVANHHYWKTLARLVEC